MSLTASVMWLGGGSEDLAKQRHKNGAYSVGNHDNADIIGNWHMSKFWDDSVIFARQKQINVIAVDNGTESWIGGVVGNVEVEEKVLALKMFADTVQSVLSQRPSVLVISLEDGLDLFDRIWPRSIVNALASCQVVQCVCIPYRSSGMIPQVAVVFCLGVNAMELQTRFPGLALLDNETRGYEGLLEALQRIRGKPLNDSEGRPNGYYERLKYFRTEEFDEIVTLISFHMSDD